MTNNISTKMEANPRIRIFESPIPAVCNIYCLSGTFGGHEGPSNLYSYLLTDRVDRYNSNIITVDTSRDLKICVDELVEAIVSFNTAANLPIILLGWSQGGYTVINAVKKLKTEGSPLLKKVKSLVIISSRPENTEFLDEMENINKYFIWGDQDTQRRIDGTKNMFQRSLEPKEIIVIPGGTHNFEYEDCFIILYGAVSECLSKETNRFL